MRGASENRNVNLAPLLSRVEMSCVAGCVEEGCL